MTILKSKIFFGSPSYRYSHKRFLPYVLINHGNLPSEIINPNLLDWFKTPLNEKSEELNIKFL